MKKLFAPLLALLLLPCAAQAAKIPDLYEIQLPVAAQERDERIGAYRVAIERLLIRITGDTQIARKPGIDQILKNPLNYLARFNYMPLAPRWEGKFDDSNQPYSQMINVVFDEEVLNRALRQLKIQLWSKTRPSALFWVAVQDDEFGRAMLDQNKPTPALDVIQEQAKLRGIPVLFPLWDLQDQRLAPIEDVWGNAATGILEASKRYESEAVIIGRVYRDPFGVWAARWTLQVEGESIPIQADGADALTVVSNAIGAVSDQLAARFVHTAVDEQQGASEFFVHVTDIGNLSSYVRAIDYLDSLESVSEVRTERVDPASAIFRVLLRTDRRGLERAISLSNVLSVATPDQSFEPQAQHLFYRLLP